MSNHYYKYVYYEYITMHQARCEPDYPVWIFSSALVPTVKSKLKIPRVLISLGACTAGILTRGVGKIGPHGPLPLAQSAAHSMSITARATSYIHTYQREFWFFHSKTTAKKLKTTAV